MFLARTAGGTRLGRENDGHLAETLGADEFEGFKDVCFVLDPEFGIRFETEDAFSQGDFSDLATDTRLRKLFLNLFDFGRVRWREQHFHTIEPG